MPKPLHQRVLNLLRAEPQLAVELLTIVEPDRRDLWFGRRWSAGVNDGSLRVLGLQADDHERNADLVILLAPEDMQDGKERIVVVVECQL